MQVRTSANDEDKKFFIEILKEYAKHYGESKIIGMLPPIDLDPYETIQESIDKMRRSVTYSGMVRFNLPVRAAHLDAATMVPIRWAEEPTTLPTFGEIQKKLPNGGYVIQYDPLDTSKTATVNLDDIISFEDEAGFWANWDWNREGWVSETKASEGENTYDD